MALRLPANGRMRGGPRMTPPTVTDVPTDGSPPSLCVGRAVCRSMSYVRLAQRTAEHFQVYLMFGDAEKGSTKNPAGVNPDGANSAR
jgi:hypothetical protein